MPIEFRVQTRSEGQSAVIVVSGELDLATGPELETALKAICGPRTRLLVVDLRQLDFMDSTGLRILVRTQQRLSDEGCEMGLVRGSPQVQRLLDLTGVAERLTLVDQPEDLLQRR